MTRLCILLAFTIALVAPVSAQQATPPARKVTIVHAGELLDRPGQKPRGNSTIIIEDGKIAEVRDGFAPADAQAHLNIQHLNAADRASGQRRRRQLFSSLKSAKSCGRPTARVLAISSALLRKETGSSSSCAATLVAKAFRC